MTPIVGQGPAAPDIEPIAIADPGAPVPPAPNGPEPSIHIAAGHHDRIDVTLTAGSTALLGLREPDAPQPHPAEIVTVSALTVRGSSGPAWTSRTVLTDDVAAGGTLTIESEPGFVGLAVVVAGLAESGRADDARTLLVTFVRLGPPDAV